MTEHESPQLDSLVARSMGRSEVRLAPQSEYGVQLVRGDMFTPAPIAWLWPGWLAQGKFHVFAGKPGCGKTTLALAIGAVISTGGRWPDGTLSPTGDILVWSGEDDHRDTLVPRLIAMGANMARVHFVTNVIDDAGRRPFDPAFDVPLLADAAKGKTIQLLIVDPVVAAVSGDGHKSNSTRRSLQPLVDFGAQIGAAIIGVSHFTKKTQGADPLERVTGSIAFAALARIVLVAAKGKGEGAPYVLARAKSNIGPDEGGFEYDIDQVNLGGGVETSYIRWGEPLTGAAREILGQAEDQSPEPGGAKEAAEEFLRQLLQAGPVASQEVKRVATEAGHAWATIRRGKAKLGVEAIKEGMSAGWLWRLPEPKVLNNAEDAHQNEVSTFGSDEHLRAADLSWESF
jgi:putative DNA primase/helicase